MIDQDTPSNGSTPAPFPPESAPAAAVDTGPACNNCCFVCPRSPSSDPPAAPCDLPPGAGAIVVHGGEPTLRRDLEPLLERAREAGRLVTLDTNARTCAADERARRLRQAGIASAVITLHGAREVSHDFLTRTPGSFRQTIAGALRLRAAGVTLGVRLLVSRSSLPELPQMATVALGLGAQAIRLSWARMEPVPGSPDLAAINAQPRTDAKGTLRVDPDTPAGDRRGYDQCREWLVPRYAIAAEPVAVALRAIRNLRRPATVDGVPLCLVPSGTRVDASPPTCSLPAPPADDFAAPCQRCAARARCPGVPRGYLARFGPGELRPAAS